MTNRLITACILVLSTFVGFGCSETETHDSYSGGVEITQTPLIDVLRSAHPELYKDIAVQGTTPDGAAILFIVNKGGTYVFRRGTGQAPEAIHHAKIIAPNSITRITYKDRSFMLWSGDKLQLTLAGYP